MKATLSFYLRLAVRRAPAMLLLFLVSAALGILLALRLPTTYETTARLIVQPQQISEALAASTVQINALEEVRILQEQLLTRANLLEIADDHEVFEMRDQMLPGDIVEEMREATRILSTGGASRRSGPQPVLVSVEFNARAPQIAADVVNDYVTRLLAENARIRAGAAGETLEFFEQEVQRLGTELDIRSTAISDFQRENASALPDDQDFRLNRMTLLQERLGAVERERRNLENTRTRTIEIFEATGRLGTAPTVNLSPEERELMELERELSRALTTFSETAPQVLQLKRRVELLRDEVAGLQAVPGANAEAAGTGAEALLALQMAELDTRMEALTIERGEIETEIAELETAIARTPLNAITLAGLQRDYDNLRGQYDNAVQRLAQASVGERIEVSARGQRITLIEPAAVPTSPASPNRTMIAAGGIGLGLALAAGFFLLMELLNSRIRRPAEITNKLGITPLAVLPYMESGGERFMRRAARVTAALVVLVGVPAILWAVDTYYLPLDLLADRMLDRLGLG
ncbi:MAG: lipopolysaccharide biosynthesis [Pseudomonadota bacterium]